MLDLIRHRKSNNKTIITRANQKLWMNKEVRRRLRKRNTAFKSGEVVALRSARTN